MLKKQILHFVSATALAVAVCCGAFAQEFSATAEEVAEWHVAADKGEAWAQYNLGCVYSVGEGVAVDHREAARWYRKAAEQNVVWAQYFLSTAYSSGRGVAENKREAMRWMHEAAEQGHPQAQYNVGVAYLSGEGVAKDEREAYIWFSIGAAHGNEQSMKNLVEINWRKFFTRTELGSMRKEVKRRLEEVERRVASRQHRKSAFLVICEIEESFFD